MKKRLLTLSTLILGSTSIFAQLPVSQTVQKKNYLLEEATGIHCGYCPDGHARANQIAADNPGKVVLVNIHAGSFATAQAGEPNLKTTDGTAIDTWFQTGDANYGYPTGASNRRDQSGVLTSDRGSWAGLASTIINEDSPVNIAMEASINASTRQVTVNVELYYTSPFSNGTNHYLNVGILQDNFEGPQSNYGNYNPSAILPNGKYLHQHIFRGFINTNGTWGDVIDASSTGVISKTYTYTLPANINSVNLDISNLKFFAIIGQGHNNSTNSSVYNATEVDPTYTNVPTATASLVSVLNTLNVACDNPATITPQVRVTNSGQAITSLAFSVAVNGGTPYVYNWTGNIPTLGTADITIPNVPTFVPGSTNNVQITLTSVNSGSGVVGSTSNVSKSISVAPTAVGSDFTVEVLTDNYPAETTWKLLNSSGTVVASGGPYVGNGQNSGGADALKTKTHAVTLTASDCYDFKLFDSYGDGMAYGTNPGGGYGFKIKQGNTVIYSKISTPFNCSTATGNQNETVDITEGVLNLTYNAGVKLEELNNTLSVYPNPASSQINVEFLADNTDYTISITDLSGRVVSSKEYSKLSGNQNIEVSLNGVSEGNYILTVSSELGKVNKNISVK